MPLTKLSILQIGDVHLPEWKVESSDVDLKISRFSDRIVSDLQTSSLTLVLESIRDLARLAQIDAAVLMGDLTSWGKTEYLVDAATIIKGLINDTQSTRNIPIFGVPGNHDVSKKDAIELGDLGKFRALETAYAQAGWPKPPVQSYTYQQLTSADGVTVPLYLLNSSIGSWSKALYPDGMREAVFASSAQSPIKVADAAPFGDSATSMVAAEDLTSQVYEQLDTPYFRAIDIQAIAERMERERGTAIVVSHHNLLPQYTPRISHFGEVLNAGYARQLFLASGARIIYLHGHIHTDPIEMVRSTSDDGIIVTISAPVIWKGYNLVSLYQEADGTPFVAKVTTYRTSGTGLTTATKLIPLIIDPAELLKRGVSRLWTHLRDKYGTNSGEVFNWAELLAYSRQVRVPDDELEPTLLALYCSGMVDIRNFGSATSAWRVTLKG